MYSLSILFLSHYAPRKEKLIFITPLPGRKGPRVIADHYACQSIVIKVKLVEFAFSIPREHNMLNIILKKCLTFFFPNCE